MINVKISLMEKSDIQAAIEVLSLAMLNNPIHCAVFQGNGELQRLEIENMFYKVFTNRPGITFLAKDGQKIVGVMRMKSCAGPETLDVSSEVADENAAEWRISEWHREWASHDPAELHWHLGPIGVLPSHQGTGVGSQLLQRFCREVDLCSARAYLETDLDKNVHFYESFKFEVVSTSELFNVTNHYMLRSAET